MPNARTDEKRKWPAPLWNTYWKGGKSASIRNQIVAHFHSLLAPFVARLRRRLPGYVDPDLLESAAGQGLIEAVEQFDPTKSDDFPSFAQMVMRRRVTDALRRHDAGPCHGGAPDDKQRVRMETALSQQLGRRPSEEELDQFLGNNAQNAIAQTAPKRRARRGENRCLVKREPSSFGTDGAPRSLEVRNAAILRLYLEGDFSQQRIAELFGITQARVSQIVQQVRKANIPYESNSGRRGKDSSRP